MHGRLGEFAGPVGGCQDQRAAAIGHQTALGREVGAGSKCAAGILGRPAWPGVIRTGLAYAGMIAAAACRTCSRNDVPPTPVPSIQRGTMAREGQIWTGAADLTVAIPSM